MISTLYLMVGRGGSKGVPNKNIREIGGLSLVGWKARAARQCDPKCRLIISTESEEIALEAKRHGVDVPFKRPDELATDTASSASVIKHAIEQLALNGEGFEQVMLLEPSTPFTSAKSLRYALTTMEAFDCDAVIGMREVQPNSAFVGDIPRDGSIRGIIESMNAKGQNLRRQDFGMQWTASGSLYLFKTEMFLRTGSIYGSLNSKGILVDRWSGIEIDSMEDLAFAEFAYERGYIAKPYADELHSGSAAAFVGRPILAQ